MFPRVLIFTVFLFAGFVSVTNSAKILGLFHFPGRSQHILGSYLLQELAARGHEVTMASPFPSDNPPANYTDLFIDDGLFDYMNENVDIVNDMLKGKEMSVVKKLSVIPRAFQDFGRIFLESPTLKKFLANPDNKFDLVILLWNMNEAFLGISHHFNAPTIAFCTIGASPLINSLFSNPSPYAMVPGIFLASTESFLDRVKNTIAGFIFEMLLSTWSRPIQEELLAKHFPNAPKLQELVDEVNIALLNSHPAIEGSKPYMPNMIPIGGFHSQTPAPLPNDLQHFLDDATHGAVLFSFGSNIKLSIFAKERIENILKQLGSIPQRVLLRYDKEYEGKVPGNMIISKWLPQTSILAHKNVKLFITHAGLGSVAESIYNSVPMICIPFFGDQNKNCDDTIGRKYGVKMSVAGLDDDSLVKTIKDVINNPLYKQKINAASDFYRSQPMKPLDKAIFWVEHVLKHNGSSHFPKSSGTKLSLYQYLLLDVLALFAVILLAIFLIFRTLARLLCKLLFSSNKNKQAAVTKSKKKN